MESVAQHLKKRYMNTHLHKVWVSEENRCATFPLWNLSGQMVGYQRYQPDKSKTQNNDPTEGRYFTRAGSNEVGTYSTEKWAKGPVAVWGLEAWNLSSTLFLTEGIFDAARVTDRGYAALAVLSYAVSPQLKNWLYIVKQVRQVVCVCDNDESGLKLAKYGHKAHVVPDGDLGSSTQDYVDQLLEEYK